MSAKSGAGRSGESSPAAPRPKLTERELEVARLVALGLRNREIAARLALSVRTAEAHVESIRTKLGFRSRIDIARWVTQRDVLNTLRDAWRAER